ncbi:MAG: tetratricopeptide repeat protein [Prevotellaceae bacterium]|jgi:tetratricopeptide (TPR) repeat protein|nr:tetratricopeptide repeat protein [Prevotellaceae bacterium]
MNYYTYIFSGTFGGFDKEESEILAAWQKKTEEEKRAQFADSDTLEVVIGWYLETNNYDEAAKWLEVAKERFPNSEDFMFLEILHAKHLNSDEAVKLCNKFYNFNHEYDILLLKSTILFIQRKFEEAHESFLIFIKSFLGDNEVIAEMYLNMSVYLACLDYSDENGEIDSETDLKQEIYLKKYLDAGLESKNSMGNLLFFAERFSLYNYDAEAKRVINRAIDIDAYNKDAWRELAELCYDLGEYAEAADAYKYLIAINDDDKQLYFKCGICYQKTGKCDLAIENFLLQAQKYPEELKNVNFNASLMMGIGSNYLQMNLIEEAKSYFLEVLKIKPKHFQAFVYLGQCFYLLDDNNTALVFIQKALDLDTDLDNFEYENLYAIIAHIFVDLYYQGEKNANKDHLFSALTAYKKSLMYQNMVHRNDPFNPEKNDSANSSILTQIGKIYFVLDDYVHALIYLQLAFRFDETTPQLNAFLTVVYLYLGMRDDATVHYYLIPEEEYEKYQYDKTFPIMDTINKGEKI